MNKLLKWNKTQSKESESNKEDNNASEENPTTFDSILSKLYERKQHVENEIGKTNKVILEIKPKYHKLKSVEQTPQITKELQKVRKRLNVQLKKHKIYKSNLEKIDEQIDNLELQKLKVEEFETNKDAAEAMAFMKHQAEKIKANLDTQDIVLFDTEEFEALDQMNDILGYQEFDEDEFDDELRAELGVSNEESVSKEDKKKKTEIDNEDALILAELEMIEDAAALPKAPSETLAEQMKKLQRILCMVIL
eukprot:snap_masked-scaffold_8-processed-gene-3.37-mRNA-1 protein AED:1.00 eAED:1.00 QI:0/0/0/0/1/1/2/0/249